MSETNDFALVPRAPSSLEKAEPGAKRILSGMVADTLALAKKEPSRKPRPLRIVMLDDEAFVLETLKLVWSLEYSNAELLTFTDTQKALQELQREDPDLFTTDWNHYGMRGPEILKALAARKVKYPVFVISAFAPEENVVVSAGPGLNVTLLRKPFNVEQLRALLREHFGPGDGLELRKEAL
jgi:DNA-binding NtrC family response regulator